MHYIRDWQSLGVRRRQATVDSVGAIRRGAALQTTGGIAAFRDVGAGLCVLTRQVRENFKLGSDYCDGTRRLIVVGVAVAVATIITESRTGGLLVPLEALRPSQRLLLTAQSLMFYVWKLVWPTRLSPYYPRPAEIALF